LTDDAELLARIEAWPAAAIRLLPTPHGSVRVHLTVSGTAHLERFDREGRWLESEFAFWSEDGRRLADRALGDVLEAFGVAAADSIAQEMSAAAEPLVESPGSRWKELGFTLSFWAPLLGGWIAALALAIVVLVLVFVL
jgi:hypothetical protein